MWKEIVLFNFNLFIVSLNVLRQATLADSTRLGLEKSAPAFAELPTDLPLVISSHLPFPDGRGKTLDKQKVMFDLDTLNLSNAFYSPIRYPER